MLYAVIIGVQRSKYVVYNHRPLWRRQIAGGGTACFRSANFLFRRMLNTPCSTFVRTCCTVHPSIHVYFSETSNKTYDIEQLPRTFSTFIKTFSPFFQLSTVYSNSALHVYSGSADENCPGLCLRDKCPVFLWSVWLPVWHYFQTKRRTNLITVEIWVIYNVEMLNILQKEVTQRSRSQGQHNAMRLCGI